MQQSPLLRFRRTRPSAELPAVLPAARCLPHRGRWSIVALGATLAVLGAVPSSAAGSTSETRHERFYVADPSASRSAVRASASAVERRLFLLGVRHAEVRVRGHSVAVRWRGPSAATVNAATAPGRVLVRPLLCLAPPPKKVAHPGAPPVTACGPSTSSETVEDAALASYATTRAGADELGMAVLLPAPHADGGGRVFLGPAVYQFGSGVRAVLVHELGPLWGVKIELGGDQLATWNDVEDSQFHRVEALDLDGQAVDEIPVEPATAAFRPFAASFTVGFGPRTSTASLLAADVTTGPLAAGLRGVRR